MRDASNKVPLANLKYYEAVLLCINSTYRLGFYRLPSHIASIGWLPAAAYMFGMTTIICHCVDKMIAVTHLLCKRYDVQHLSYQDTAIKAMQGAKSKFPLLSVLTAIPDALTIYMCFVRAANLIVQGGKLMAKILNKLLDEFYDNHTCYMFMYVPIAILMQVRDKHGVVAISAIGSALLLAQYVAYVVYRYTASVGEDDAIEFDKDFALITAASALPMINRDANIEKHADALYDFIASHEFSLMAFTVDRYLLNRQHSTGWLGVHSVVSIGLIILNLAFEVVMMTEYGMYLTIDYLETPLLIIMFLGAVPAVMAQILIAFDMMWCYYIRPRHDDDSMVVPFEFLVRFCVCQFVFSLPLIIPHPDLYQRMLSSLYFSLLGLLLPSITVLCMRYPDNYGWLYWRVFVGSFYMLLAGALLVVNLGFGMTTFFNEVDEEDDIDSAVVNHRSET